MDKKHIVVQVRAIRVPLITSKVLNRHTTRRLHCPLSFLSSQINYPRSVLIIQCHQLTTTATPRGFMNDQRGASLHIPSSTLPPRASTFILSLSLSVCQPLVYSTTSSGTGFKRTLTCVHH